MGLLIASVKGFLVAGNFMHLLDEVKSIYWILILSVIFFIPLFFIPLLWDNDLVKENKVGMWVGQSNKVEHINTHKEDEKGH